MAKRTSIIRGGHLIDPSSGIDAPKDLLIEGDRIADIGEPGIFGKLACDESIDATNKWIVPGLIDLHVHLREPGLEWKETIKSGTKAAALGGFTSVCSMPNTAPVNDTQEVTEYILRKAREARYARVLPIGAVSKKLEGRDMAPYSELREAGCVALSDDGEPIYNAGIMRRALEWCAMLGITISCHEEDKNLSCGGCMNEGALSTKLGLQGWPKVAEEVMIARDIELARTTRGRVHFCHVSTARGAELVRRAKNDGISVTAETTPHHLTLTEDAVGEYDTLAKMSPPLRNEEDVEALLKAIADGTIDAIASDHAPHDRDAKLVEFAKASIGTLGLQTNLPILLDFIHKGQLSRLRAFSLFTSGPAGCFALPFGKLTKGAAADILLIDPLYRWRFDATHIASLSQNSVFLGREFKGIADMVIVGGEIVVRDKKIAHA